MWRQGPHAQSSFQRFSITRRFFGGTRHAFVSIWFASRTYPHDAPVDNRPCPQSARPTVETRGGHTDEIVCANTAFRYWRCPPQVRDLYPRLPNSEDGWRALAQAPFVTDVLKTPIITTTEPGGVNYHSGLRTTIHCDDAFGVDSTLETAMSLRVTNPLATLFTMARFVSPTDLVLAMYEFCGWFSVFEPTAAAEAELDKAEDAAENAAIESLFDHDESQEESQWKRIYARIKVKEQVNTKGPNGQKKTNEVTKLKGTSLWMRKPLIELHELHEYAN